MFTRGVVCNNKTRRGRHLLGVTLKFAFTGMSLGREPLDRVGAHREVVPKTALVEKLILLSGSALDGETFTWNALRSRF